MPTYRSYKKLCKAIVESKLVNYVYEKSDFPDSFFVMIKHDVEKNPKKALKIAKIENKHHLMSTFYFQAYLLNDKNLNYLKKIQSLGHIVSYHHDVMDQTKGKIEEAMDIFKKNVSWFDRHNFKFLTICQHGNPLVEREGYYSNRDFFRSKIVQSCFPDFIDIMVNFPNKITSNYLYISDAGRKWKIISSPTTNDLPSFNGKDVPIMNIYSFIKNTKENLVISCHSHRYYYSALVSFLHVIIFIVIKFLAKRLIKIPFVKKWFQKYYWIAKKI